MNALSSDSNSLKRSLSCCSYFSVILLRTVVLNQGGAPPQGGRQ